MWGYCEGMIDTTVAYPIVALVAIYALVFFWSPHRVAEFWGRDVGQRHTIMQHFRFRERTRVCAAGIGLTACLVLSSAFGSSILFVVGMFLGLACLGCVDALQIRAISRAHLSVS